ncbi:MAG: nitrogen fixation protein NifH, partial [Oscillospiraceae bacterium]|jgi:nitrogenase iron protein|nr:nitrogen fixation protein NifH [Oscillospiraceae bacterium]
VLQIGCDPKHDSTRLLLRGKTLTTALDYMRVTNPPDYSLDEVLAVGYGGVGCVEAGGPKPGVGCAGRGIISTFELLGQFGLKEKYDITLYDVLGDVVCGGFAVPIRREYADTIFIVTSGEFMALYAANNILRGILSYDGDGGARVAGLILNRRRVTDETERVTRFAKAVGLPVVAEIPRAGVFGRAEARNMTLAEFDPGGAEAALFRNLAADILRGARKYPARPLTDARLERVVLKTENAPISHPEPGRTAVASARSNGTLPSETREPREVIDFTSPNRYLSKNVVHGEPLHGCAFNGALTMSAQLRDAVILAHAPKSCTYISYQTMSSTGRRRLFERGALLPSSIAPNLESTDMGEPEMIFGGMEKLADRVAEIKARRPKAIVIVSSCPAGIIGDDIDAVRNLGDESTPVFTLRADGNMSGDYLQGMLMCYTELARQVIRRDVQPESNTVNIVFEKVISKNTADSFAAVESYLNSMGVRVNCRFLCDTGYDSLVNFNRASLNLLAYRDYTGELLEDFFTREYGSKFFGMQFPVGFHETEEWLRGVAEFFGARSVAEDIISRSRERYEREIDELRSAMLGKRLMILTYNHELDWLLGAALDAGIKLVKLGVLDFSQDEGFRTRLRQPLPVEENYNAENRAADVARYKPDILLTNYTSSAAGEARLADTIPMSPDVGFFTGLNMIKRWAGLLAMDLKGEWERDEQLFRKYYTV